MVDEVDVGRIARFVRNLKPSAFKTVDTFCTFIAPFLKGSSDPRVTAFIGALQAACVLRSAFRRKRS